MVTTDAVGDRRTADVDRAAARLDAVAVSNSRAVSKSHRTRPSVVEKARKCPSIEPPNTAPGIAAPAPTAPGCTTACRRTRSAAPPTLASRSRAGSQTVRRRPPVQAAASEGDRILEGDVRHRHVHVRAVARRSPLDAAELAALADRRRSTAWPRCVGIERVHDARLLAGDEDPLAVRQRDQDRRLAEVVIGSGVLRTVRRVGGAARHRVRITGGHLLRPLDGAGVEVERDDGVGQRRGGRRVAIAGRDVERIRRGSTVGADHTAAPDGPHSCTPLRVLRARRRRLRNHVGAPQLIAGRGIERDDAAAERAAFIGGRRADGFLSRRHGTYRRPSYSTADPVIRAARCSSSFFFQRSSPVDGVDAVERGAQIAEVRRGGPAAPVGRRS